MRMTVSPKEIADHLVQELGHTKAIEACEYHLSRCKDDETASVWTNIGNALSNLPAADKRQ